MVFPVISRNVHILVLGLVALVAQDISGAATSSSSSSSSSSERYGLIFAATKFEPKMIAWMKTKLLPQEQAEKLDALFGRADVRDAFYKLFHEPVLLSEKQACLERLGFVLIVSASGGFVVKHKEAFPGFVIKLAPSQDGTKDALWFTHLGRIWQKEFVEKAACAHDRSDILCPEKYFYCAKNTAIRELVILVVAEEFDLSKVKSLKSINIDECAVCNPVSFVRSVCDLTDCNDANMGYGDNDILLCWDLEPRRAAQREIFKKDPFATYQRRSVVRCTCGGRIASLIADYLDDDFNTQDKVYIRAGILSVIR